MYLNKIKDNDGARYKSKVLGRGIGSGKGKTCARGGKGQTARSGVAIGSFEGGQMPLYIRLPKRGFNSIGKIKYEVVNFDLLDLLVESGEIDANNVTIESLKKANVIKGKNTKVKLLGDGVINHKFNITLNAISNAAREKLEASGGKVSIEK